MEKHLPHPLSTTKTPADVPSPFLFLFTTLIQPCSASVLSSSSSCYQLLLPPPSILVADFTLAALSLSVFSSSVHIQASFTFLKELFVRSKRRTSEDHNMSPSVLVSLCLGGLLLPGFTPIVRHSVTYVRIHLPVCLVRAVALAEQTPCCGFCGAVPVSKHHLCWHSETFARSVQFSSRCSLYFLIIVSCSFCHCVGLTWRKPPHSFSEEASDIVTWFTYQELLLHHVLHPVLPNLSLLSAIVLVTSPCVLYAAILL